MSSKSRKPAPQIKTLLSERIYQSRQAKGLSQEQLAARLGVNPKTVKNWESERSAPRANRLNQMAGVLDVPIMWLIAGAESPPEMKPPNLNETSAIEAKLNRAEALITELSKLIFELRQNTRRVQRTINNGELISIVDPKGV